MSSQHFHFSEVDVCSLLSPRRGLTASPRMLSACKAAQRRGVVILRTADAMAAMEKKHLKHFVLYFRGKQAPPYIYICTNTQIINISSTIDNNINKFCYPSQKNGTRQRSRPFKLVCHLISLYIFSICSFIMSGHNSHKVFPA